MSAHGKTILFLGVDDTSLIDWLGEREHLIHTADAIDLAFLGENSVGFIVSYGYRYIIGPEILAALPDRAINLHISLLPWNRGADPNFWSFVEDTPKGVTIHYMDAGIDTGDIIVQREMVFEMDGSETLATSYRKLTAAIEALFCEHWDAIRSGDCPRIRQSGPGSYHRSRDLDAVSDLLTRGWDTPVNELRGRAG